MLLTELKDFKTKLEYHHNLNPALWDGDVLHKEVKRKFNDIKKEFLEYLELPMAKLKDILFTGSNTNYNWTELSDIDLHFVVDPKGLDMDGLDAKKSLWNLEHDISIKGFTVEVYIESSDTNQSGNAGLYSVKDDKWIREPKFENIKFDYDKIKTKSKIWMNKIDKLIDSKSTDLTKLIKIKDDIKTIRHRELAKGGEFTLENLVFKSLRNNGYIEKLMKYIRKLEDAELSIK